MTHPDQPQQQRRCARGDRCLTSELDSHGHLMPGSCDRVFCDPCEQAVARALDDAPTLYVGVRNRALVRGQGKRSSDKVSLSAGSPMPLNAHELDLGEQLHWLLTTWEDVVRDIASATPTTRRPWDVWERTEGRAREGREVQAAAKFLRAHLTAWLQAPATTLVTSRTSPDLEQAGWEAALTLLAWRTAAMRNTADAPKHTVRYTTPCMYCGVEAVCHRAGEDLVQCLSCWKTWDLDLYPIKVAAFARHITDLERAR